MAESSNSNSLIAQFEKSYSETMATLTQEDFVYDKSPETLKAELDTKITKFTDLARQMETFFLQKQFLVYAHKPGNYNHLILRIFFYKIVAVVCLSYYFDFTNFEIIVCYCFDFTNFFLLFNQNFI